MDVDDCLDPFVKVFNDLGFFNPCAISLCLGISCYFYKLKENSLQTVFSKSQKIPINCVTRPQQLIHNNTSPNCKCNDVCDSSCPCIQGLVKSKNSSYQSRGYCEKYCKCSYICPYKFLGCDCEDSCNSSSCVCFLNSIECDISLCRSCRHPKQDNSRTFQCLNQKYQNQPIQKTVLKVSTIKNAGIGLFAKKPITKGQFIGEYTGELVNDKEADRRGRIYDIKEHSFVFNIDCMHSVDATYYGNKMKFINHMPSEKANCDTQIWRVLGTSKILIFASVDINEGDELFFDYKYPINVPYRWYHEA
jgi:histone-lysine N-methyltransferase EZH2